MKKFFIALVLAAVLGIWGIWGCNSEEPAPETEDVFTYELTGIVVKVEDHLVRVNVEMPCCDGAKHTWQFYGNGYEVGQLVNLTFADDHETFNNHHDDAIVDAAIIESL